MDFEVKFLLCGSEGINIKDGVGFLSGLEHGRKVTIAVKDVARTLLVSLSCRFSGLARHKCSGVLLLQIFRFPKRTYCYISSVDGAFRLGEGDFLPFQS